jgi:hypothetical protein
MKTGIEGMQGWILLLAVLGLQFTALINFSFCKAMVKPVVGFRYD